MFLGVDPDLHCTAFAVVSQEREVIDLWTAETKGETGQAACVAMARALAHTPRRAHKHEIKTAAIEGQDIYVGRGRTQNPKSIMLLASVAGAALMLVERRFSPAEILYPRPADWKGQVPKEIHHTRLCGSLGWRFERRAGYCRPWNDDAGFEFPATKWKHLMDAIGLALWARERTLRFTAVASAAQSAP